MATKSLAALLTAREYARVLKATPALRGESREAWQAELWETARALYPAKVA